MSNVSKPSDSGNSKEPDFFFQNPPSIPGKNLIEVIDNLYLFLEHWRTEYPTNFHLFTLIKQIAQVSNAGGHFLSEREEMQIISALEELKEGLCSGKVRLVEVAELMNKILLDLIENNSKAKLVFQTTKIEYLMHLNAFYKNENREKVNSLLQRIISTINPKQQQFHANALAKELSVIFSKENSEAILPLLEKIVEKWIISNKRFS